MSETVAGRGSLPPPSSARQAMVEAAARLAVRPGLTLAALVAGALGALAFAAGNAGARAVLSARHLEGLGTALLLLAIAGTVGTFAALGGVSAVLGRDGRGMLGRATGIISLVAVERLIQGCLVMAALLPLLRWSSAHSDASPGAHAGAMVAALAPTLPLWLLVVPAFAVAVARAAAGEANWRALAMGLHVAMHNWGLLARTMVFSVVVTAPLWALPLLLAGDIAASQHAALAVAATATAGAMGALAALTSYAALLGASRGLAGEVVPAR